MSVGGVISASYTPVKTKAQEAKSATGPDKLALRPAEDRAAKTRQVKVAPVATGLGKIVNKTA